MNLYRELIIDLYKNPVNKRSMPDAHITNSGANVTCGDRVRIYIKKDSEKITDLSFEGEGCAISIAAASLLTEEAKGVLLNDISDWGPHNIFEWLGTELGPARIKCGLLALETLQEAVKKIKQ
ncbi:Fe-S cluster protein [Candidatus Peregrinibacteria bacterium CG11_big_fil_rev_8_21_14_0_20_46_8]|nr:MAG: Fe-S cluster protein [Candidatus Peregrinibacteria bacterium CG11_big_fil_rev_8_21_14_0_20_46_8]